MSVTFHEEPSALPPEGPHKMGFITKLILNIGLARTNAQAQIVMLIISLSAIALTVYVLFLR